MAYITQDEKKSLAVGIKKVLKKYGMKGSISIQHLSTIIVKIPKGRLNIIGEYRSKNLWGEPIDNYKVNHLTVNKHFIKENFNGESRSFIQELNDALQSSEDGKVKNYDDSNAHADYFDVGYYTRIEIGSWNKPYLHVAS